MKIVAVCGSPRKGNTEWMLTRLLEQLTLEGAQVELLLLRKMDIKICTGCLKCEDRKGACSLKDDMQDTYPKLLEADAIVLGTPVYFDMLSGLMKNFIDRTCPLWTKMQGKPSVGLAVAEDGIGQAIRNLKAYAKICQFDWVGSVTSLAKEPGQVKQHRGIDRRLKHLAHQLILRCEATIKRP